jgi:hypothetical protein
MFRRLIAGTVLVLLCCWSVPVARASVRPADDLAAQKPHSSIRHNHSCCPNMRTRFEPSVVVTLAPSKMPCGDQHPCCARQVPDSPPLLSAISRMPRPDSGGLLMALPDQGCRRWAVVPSSPIPFEARSFGEGKEMAGCCWGKHNHAKSCIKGDKDKSACCGKDKTAATCCGSKDCEKGCCSKKTEKAVSSCSRRGMHS